MSSSEINDPERVRRDLTAKKEATLDPFLADMIIARAIVHDGILEKPKYMAIHNRLKNRLKETVDDSIIAVVLIEDDDSPTSPPTTAPKWQTAVSSHQKMDEVIKDLILTAYGVDVPRPFLRKKITLCRSAVIAFVNSQDFYEIIRREASNENLHVKRRSVPNRFNLAAIKRAVGL